MKTGKTLGFVFLILGFYVLFYKKTTCYGCFDSCDRSWGNIIISLILLSIASLLLRKYNWQ